MSLRFSAKDIIEPVMHSGESLQQFHSNLSRLTDTWPHSHPFLH